MADPTNPYPTPEDAPGVQWQLAELRTITTSGFAKIDGRVEGIEKEQKDLGTRVTRVEVKQDIADKRSLDPTKVILALIALVAAWFTGGAVGLPGT
jgi:hypothetical protein